jgi:hypothetical protein
MFILVRVLSSTNSTTLVSELVNEVLSLTLKAKVVSVSEL